MNASYLECNKQRGYNNSQRNLSSWPTRIFWSPWSKARAWWGWMSRRRHRGKGATTSTRALIWRIWHTWRARTECWTRPIPLWSRCPRRRSWWTRRLSRWTVLRNNHCHQSSLHTAVYSPLILRTRMFCDSRINYSCSKHYFSGAIRLLELQSICCEPKLIARQFYNWIWFIPVYLEPTLSAHLFPQKISSSVGQRDSVGLLDSTSIDPSLKWVSNCTPNYN